MQAMHNFVVLGRKIDRVLLFGTRVACRPPMQRTTLAVVAITPLLLAGSARAQTGAAPADVSATVSAPKGPAVPEEKKPSTDSLTASANAGAQLTTGNSSLLAVSAGGKIDARVGHEGFGAAIIGNYSSSYEKSKPATSTTPATPGRWKDTVKNFQARARYERYLTSAFSLFGQLSGLYDPFQGVTFRFNVDPGAKLYFHNSPRNKFWGELGYDFEYDLNYTNSYGIELDPSVSPGFVLDPNGLPFVVNTDMTMHSARAYVGYQHAFNKEVLFTTGLEFLQGLGGSGDAPPPVPPGYTADQVDRVTLTLTRTRVNFMAAFTSSLGAGLSLAATFLAQWNSAPLPGKESLDTSTTLSLIYTYSTPPPPKPAPPPPPPPEKKPETPPPPPPPSTPPPPASTATPAPSEAAPSAPADGGAAPP